MKETCLHSRHVALGALMQPFAGFDMPIQYTSIIDEHNAVRHHCGVFDVSHMGEVIVSGPDATRFVNHIFTNDVTTIQPGKVVYGMMCYPDGGTVDDTCICKLATDRYFLTINAANIDKDNDWIRQNSEGFNVSIDYASDRFAQLAIQGPDSESVVEGVLGIPCADMKFYEVKTDPTNDHSDPTPVPSPSGRGAEPPIGRPNGIASPLPEGEGTGVGSVDPEAWCLLSRTGYTGEDGFEIYGSPEFIASCWDKLMAAHITPCGLGCRDTLRFEVGLPLYGDELSADISPIMAGLGIFVKLDKPEFIGREALLRQKTEGVAQRLRGIQLDAHAVPRHGYTVLHDGQPVGTVTTGYRLISVDKSCAVALVSSDLKLGDRVEIQIRKKAFPGTIVKKKFYEKHYKK